MLYTMIALVETDNYEFHLTFILCKSLIQNVIRGVNSTLLTFFGSQFNDHLSFNEQSVLLVDQ